MNRATFRPLSSTAYLLIVVLTAMFGCAPNQPIQTPETPPPITETAPPEISTQVEEANEPLPEPHLPDGSGEMAWAEGFPGQLIAGLDGELYEPYEVHTVERIQRSLGDRGLYAGPINGILDAPTMKAIYAFQEFNHNLQLCGIPTPRTRQMLEQGSHTDLAW